MKRSMATLVLLCSLCLALVGCAGTGGGAEASPDASAATDFVGVWELESMVSDGEAMSSDDLSLMRAFGLNVFLVVSDDGTATFNLYGEEVAGRWSSTGANVGTLTFDEDTSEFGGDATITFADDKLTVTNADDDDTTMTFARTTQEEMDAFLAESASGSDDADDAEATPLDVSVADDDLIALTLTSMEDDHDGDPNVNFTVTNKSDGRIYITGVDDSWTVGGVEVDPTISTFVDPGETIDDFLFFDHDDVESIDKLVDVKGAFEVRDDDNAVITTYDVAL